MNLDEPVTCVACGHPTTLRERFWANLEKGNPDECWPWQGPMTEETPRLHFQQRRYSARQVMWAIQKKLEMPVTEDVYRRRSCDVRCLNPLHLTLDQYARKVWR